MGSCPDTDTDPALLTPFLSVLLLLLLLLLLLPSPSPRTKTVALLFIGTVFKDRVLFM